MAIQSEIKFVIENKFDDDWQELDTERDFKSWKEANDYLETNAQEEMGDYQDMVFRIVRVETTREVMTIKKCVLTASFVDATEE